MVSVPDVGENVQKHGRWERQIEEAAPRPRIANPLMLLHLHQKLAEPFWGVVGTFAIRHLYEILSCYAMPVCNMKHLYGIWRRLRCWDTLPGVQSSIIQG